MLSSTSPKQRTHGRLQRRYYKAGNVDGLPRGPILGAQRLIGNPKQAEFLWSLGKHLGNRHRFQGLVNLPFWEGMGVARD